ncbi:MAG: SusD/RagB family nutrient-binding outer membrane lipoprotein [Bacteroidaceae bacterium]|nr:SusD/RagB family nutrient-binding outer membrane lipoprotein [Bacteroidaceae bacterium]
MKKYNKLFFTLAMGAALMAGTTSCDDFEEININPAVAGAEVVKAYYPLNNSIIGAQQSPHEAERIAVYNWASAARISGENSTFLSNGRYSDSYNHDYHNSYLSDWIKKANMAVTMAEEGEGKFSNAHDENFNKNIKSFARIWRVVMIAEYTDNFGPYPIAAFQGTNPEFNSVKDVYYFMLDELKAAVADIVLTEEPTADEAKSDPMFGFNAQKWAKYGNSLRLRLAMRLSQVDNAKAKSEFEAVDKNMLITTMADISKVKEYNQWNAWAGIYSRSWNIISLPSTMSNILVGLGGVSVADQRPDLAQYTKPMNYLGMQFADHYADKTDNPTKGYWMDGIPENLDPRALRIYCIPGDKAADNFRDYGSSDIKNTTQPLNDADGEKILDLQGQFTWNYYPAGSRGAWSPKFAKNYAVGSWYDTMLPVLCKTYGGDSEGERIWFGPWETHFLLAEASLYGWSTGTTAKAAYEQGIRTSFENFGVSQYVDAYLASEDYNRVGVSVAFDHTAEPTNFTADYVNGYTNQAGTVTYEYPNASKSLYKDGLNTQLAKIITQKYIAQTPYGTLEMWNDRRRLGLPWFDLPNNETSFVGADMENTWTANTYLEGQNVKVFPQRLRYPSSLQNADPTGYAKALELLGGADNTLTPLWWAIH